MTWPALKDGVTVGGKGTNKSVVQTFFFFFTNYLCICILFLAVLGVAARGLSLTAAHGGFSLIAACRLLIAVACLVTEHRLYGTRTSAVAAHGLSSCNSQALKQAQ